MRERTYSSVTYRFGFNGQEKDDEIFSNGNSIEYGARIYDSRLGRFFSIDPLFKIYPDYSSYSFCSNNPMMYKEFGGKGFNGGFSIINQSKEPIVIVGTSKTIITDINGNTTETESPTSRVTLQPGQRLEVYYQSTNNKDGSKSEKYTARVVNSDGSVEISDVDAWDVDYIEVQQGQTFVDKGIFWDSKYNTDPNDKSAETPNPPTGEGTIKLQPSKFDYYVDKDDANEGKVTITGEKEALIIEVGGEWENEPNVLYGEGIPHK